MTWGNDCKFSDRQERTLTLKVREGAEILNSNALKKREQTDAFVEYFEHLKKSGAKPPFLHELWDINGLRLEIIQNSGREDSWNLFHVLNQSMLKLVKKGSGTISYTSPTVGDGLVFVLVIPFCVFKLKQTYHHSPFLLSHTGKMNFETNIRVFQEEAE